MLKNQTNPIFISNEVALAKKTQKPIVALESTIITHGMPYPENYETALEAESLIRKAGCVPATIAIVRGKIKIGLSTNEIKTLSKSIIVKKLSNRDLAMGIAQKQTGSTTVAATLVLSALAEIAVFATGGIGGAHRGSNTDFDISADLKQLATTPMNVVCAGPKAILDIPKTMEILEGLGVPVITFKSKNVPAFWSRDSGLKSPIVAQSVKEIVDSYIISSKLGLKTAQLIFNPVQPKYEIKADVIEPLINKSIELAAHKGVKGKDLTPFLLSEILATTEGKSLVSNKALLFNNIDLATKIANTLSKADATALSIR